MSIPRLRLLLAAAAATAVALTGTAGPAVAAGAPATTTDPAAAAAGWLAQQFRDSTEQPSPDGDHFNFPPYGTDVYYYSGLTADAIFGLAASKSGKDRITAALAFMASKVGGDAGLGDPTGSPGPYDGTVAKAALAAIVGGADPTAFGGFDLLQSLKASECTGVSGPVDQNDYTTPLCAAKGAARNIYSSVSESLVITAEARGAILHGAQYAPSADAVAYFLSLRCPDGGFTGSTSVSGTCTSGVDETAYAANALQALGGHQAELDAADAYLRSKRNAAGYWEGQGAPNVDSTGLATAALDAAGDDVSASRAWLATQQVTDGPTVGAGATRGALKYLGSFDPDSSIKATADGLRGLAPGGSLATLTAAGATAGAAVLAPVSTAASERVRQGGRQTVSGVGFAAGEKVTVVLHSTPVKIGVVAATANGDARSSFTVPVDLEPGAHTVVLTGETSGLTATVGFDVVASPVAQPATGSGGDTTGGATGGGSAAPAANGGDALANSGLDGRAALELTVVGLGLVVAGSGVVYAGRRRA